MAELDIRPLLFADRQWVMKLADVSQVYCPRCGEEDLGLAAISAETPLGYIVWQIVVDEATLLGVAVYKRQRHCGVATAMHKYSEQQLLSQRVKKLFLEVRRSNTIAQTCYHHLGYKIIGERKNYYRALNNIRQREDAIIMSKSISI